MKFGGCPWAKTKHLARAVRHAQSKSAPLMKRSKKRSIDQPRLQPRVSVAFRTGSFYRLSLRVLTEPSQIRAKRLWRRNRDPPEQREPKSLGIGSKNLSSKPLPVASTRLQYQAPSCTEYHEQNLGVYEARQTYCSYRGPWKEHLMLQCFNHVCRGGNHELSSARCTCQRPLT